MLLLQSTCPVATMELCCGFLLELRSFLEEGFRFLGPELNKRNQEHDMLGVLITLPDIVTSCLEQPIFPSPFTCSMAFNYLG